MIETIDPGAIGTAGPGGAGNGWPGESPSTPAGVADVLARLRPAADAHRRGAGAGPVNGLLAGLAGAVGRLPGPDAEFGCTLVVELARRYLEAVRGHGRGTAVPRVWQVVLDAWTGDVPAGRIALAGAHALAGLDLPPAVVSTCTLLGRVPGPAERGDLETVVGLLSGLACDSARNDPDDATADGVRGLESLLTRGESWRQAEHLWSVRGRPTEAERDRDALDWRATLVARGVLGAAAG
ncbi:hypothetical protein BJF78_34075 [Pseudonocardia sp. CNS-139]|nr:hypothetical protein BJF78_34075 [Pseudonocardia sp. CNS-139]